MLLVYSSSDDNSKWRNGGCTECFCIAYDVVSKKDYDKLKAKCERLEDELEELKYRPGGVGMKEAEKDFINISLEMNS